MIPLGDFLAQADRAAATFQNLPVSAAILRSVSEQLKRGAPPWWAGVEKAWAHRGFAAWTEAYGLLLTALHYEALSDADNPLVRYFPSCGGTAEADPAPALAKFLSAPPRSFFQNLQHRHRRVFIQPRSGVWVAPALLFFQARGLPFYLVEINAGAGLNLAGDLYQQVNPLHPDLVAARIGLDPDPLLLSDISQRRWLTAGILPEQGELIAQLDRAIDKAQARWSREAAFIQLAECAAQKAPRFIAKNIPSDDVDVGLLVVNMGTTARMTDAEYGAFARDMAAMMAPWGDRALWVEMERVRGEIFSTTYQVRLIRARAGVLAQHVAASFDSSTGQPPAIKQEETARFLEVAAAKPA